MHPPTGTSTKGWEGVAERRYAHTMPNIMAMLWKWLCALIGMNLTGLSLSRPTILGTFQQKEIVRTVYDSEYCLDDWSRWWESNPPVQLGRLAYYRCITSTYLDRLYFQNPNLNYKIGCCYCLCMGFPCGQLSLEIISIIVRILVLLRWFEHRIFRL